MKKKDVQKAMELTQECLVRFWQKDVEFTFPYFAQDVVWIGAMLDQHLRGIETVKEDYRKIKEELQPCHLLKQQFDVAANAGPVCVIVGHYLTTTDDSTQYYLQTVQRCTFVWELIDKELKIRHIHISNPIGEMKAVEGENFVNTMGMHARKYLENKVAEKQGSNRLVVQDYQGIMRFIVLSDILYVEAEQKHTIIHMDGQEIRIRKSFKEIRERLDGNFIQIHRAYAVNLNCILKVRKYELVMKNGAILPIPAKRYNNIAEILRTNLAYNGDKKANGEC